MTKNTVQDWSTTAASNTDVGGVNIQGSAPVSNMDDALREMMKQVAAGIAAGYFNAYLTATKTANYTVLTTDRGTLFDCTSSLTLSLPAAATATAGFVIIAKANGASVILDPNGAELIDGAATVTLAAGQSALIVCTGTAWKTAFIAAAGPASSTDNAIVRFDGTTGKTLQNSGVTIDDSNNIAGVGTLSAAGITDTGNTSSLSYASVNRVFANATAGTMNFRPGGLVVTTGQMTISSAGAVTINGTLTVTG